MGSEIIETLLVPILLITTGLFLKVTTNQRFQDVKKRWKFLFWMGVVLLILKTILHLQNG
jgi:hypothetical protein